MVLQKQQSQLIPTTLETESVAETSGDEDTEIEEAATEEQAEGPETEATGEFSADGISPEFKEAMDIYETFFNWWLLRCFSHMF